MGGSILRVSGVLIILAFWAYVGSMVLMEEYPGFIPGHMMIFSHLFGFLLIFCGELDELMRKS